MHFLKSSLGRTSLFLYLLCLIGQYENEALQAQPLPLNMQPAYSAFADSATDIMVSPALGTLKILLARPKYQGDHSGLVTDAQAIQYAEDIKFAIEENSYGKLLVDYDVTPVLNMPNSGSFYKNTTGSQIRIRSDVLEVADDAGYDYDNYDRLVVVSKPYWPGQPGATIGTTVVFEGVGNPYHSAHELGHTFDWNHSNFWDVQNSPISPNGKEIEYGDAYDMMGDGWVTTQQRSFHHFNPWFKYRAGWIPEENVMTVNSSGTYTLQTIEGAPDQRDPVQSYSALRIRRNKSEDYWVFFRREESLVSNGATITLGYHSNIMPSRLFDMTPGSQSSDWRDVALAVGKTFSDAAAGITIKTVSKTSTTLQMQVTVTQTQLPRLPVIDIISPEKDEVLKGTVNFEVTAYDPDSGPSNGDGIQKVELRVYVFGDGLVSAVRKGGNASFPPDVLAEWSAPPYTVSVNAALLADRRYWTTVRAISAQGDSNMIWLSQVVDNAGPTLLKPQPPGLMSPANSSINEPVSIQLLWGAAKRADSYRFQVALDASFTNILTDQAGLVDTTYSVSGLLYNTKYYWRANASNTVGTSFSSAIWSFTTAPPPPATPILLSPLNNSIDLPENPLLAWNSVTNAISYHLQVDSTGAFSTPGIDEPSIANTNYQINGLANGTNYHWRVSASGSGGSSAWSSTWQFLTLPSAPAAPTLVAPADSSNNIPSTATLMWNAVPGASTYSLQVSTDTTFSVLNVDLQGLSTISFQTDSLPSGTTYYWHINATNSGGTSAWSKAWLFTTAFALPTAPTLVFPPDSAAGVEIAPILNWQAVAGADSYGLQLSSATDFNTTLIDTSGVIGTSLRALGLENGHTYLWRVRSSSLGGDSNWSDARRFTTLLPAPTAPLLFSPADSAINVPVEATLSWNTSPGAASYNLQVSLTPDFSSPIVALSDILDTSIQLVSLDEETEHYWRVEAVNEGGTSAWSPARIFTTEKTTSVGSDNNHIPENFSLGQNYPNPFNPGTTISFELPKSSRVSLMVFGLKGQHIATLVSGQLPAGEHFAAFDATGLPSGIYFYRLQADTFIAARKLMLVR